MHPFPILLHLNQALNFAYFLIDFSRTKRSSANHNEPEAIAMSRFDRPNENERGQDEVDQEGQNEVFDETSLHND